MSDSFGSLAWMHIDDYGRIGATGDGPWERNHQLLLDYGVEAENLIIS